MSRMRNACFASVLCALLSGPSLLLLADSVDVDLPSWVTTEDAAYLSGGIEKANVAKVANLEGFKNGNLQKEVEKEVGNSIPCKAVALLTNATLQRCAIAASDALFHWGYYPTYFGSGLLLDANNGRLFDVPERKSEALEERLKTVAGELEDLAERKRDVQIYLYFAPDSQNVLESPTSKLVSEFASYQDMLSVFKSDDGNVTVIDGSVSYGQFEQQWYKTDHHWNIAGAYEAYCRIASAMHLDEAVPREYSTVTYDPPSFYGAYSRRALFDSSNDVIADYIPNGIDNLKVSIDGEASDYQSLAHSDMYERGGWNSNRFTNRYAEYFHTDYGMIEITNDEVTDGGELLIIADSYSNCMERYLALDFSKTYVMDPRHTDVAADDVLDEHPGINKVLVLMRRTNLTSDDTIKALA